MFILYYVLCGMSHVSCLMCHVSWVTCHLSHVTCPKFFTNIFYAKKYPLEEIEQNGGASRWRVCYQRGLPRLVLKPFIRAELNSWNILTIREAFRKNTIESVSMLIPPLDPPPPRSPLL